MGVVFVQEFCSWRTGKVWRVRRDGTLGKSRKKIANNMEAM